MLCIACLRTLQQWIKQKMAQMQTQKTKQPIAIPTIAPTERLLLEEVELVLETTQMPDFRMYLLEQDRQPLVLEQKLQPVPHLVQVLPLWE